MRNKLFVVLFIAGFIALCSIDGILNALWQIAMVAIGLWIGVAYLVDRYKGKSKS